MHRLVNHLAMCILCISPCSAREQHVHLHSHFYMHNYNTNCHYEIAASSKQISCNLVKYNSMSSRWKNRCTGSGLSSGHMGFHEDEQISAIRGESHLKVCRLISHATYGCVRQSDVSTILRIDFVPWNLISYRGPNSISLLRNRNPK